MKLELENVSYSVPGRTLLDSVNIRINEGDKMSIVGRNGCGKSTLLNILAGDLKPMAGKRALSKAKVEVRVLLVKQELPDEKVIPLEFLKNKNKKLQSLITQSEEINLDTASTEEQTRFSELTEEIDEIEQYYETNAPGILIGLGISLTSQQKAMKELSGGLRMRVSLASCLLQMPDVLILDEPTNHLDLESTVWLITYLKNYSKALVIVSHDKELLNEVTTKTWHLKGGELTVYGGNYDKFIELSKIKVEADERKNIQLEKKVEKSMDLYYKFRDKPTKAGMALNRKKWAEDAKKEKVNIVEELPPVKLNFIKIVPLGDPIVSLKQVSAGYKVGNPVLANLKLDIQNDSRIGLIGRNGQGKTTFVRLISSKLQPLSGEVKLNSRLKIGYFSQDQSEVLNENNSPFSEIKKLPQELSEEKIYQHLENFGFDRKKSVLLIKKLSGGEKSRLLFAVICITEPDLIIFDEPTNHLDMQAKDELIKAINAYNGAVILVSHDWELMRKTMTTYWWVNKGQVKPYVKGLTHYKTTLLSAIERTINEAKKTQHHSEPTPKPVKSEKAADKEEKYSQNNKNKTLKQTVGKESDLVKGSVFSKKSKKKEKNSSTYSSTFEYGQR